MRLLSAVSCWEANSLFTDACSHLMVCWWAKADSQHAARYCTGILFFCPSEGKKGIFACPNLAGHFLHYGYWVAVKIRLNFRPKKLRIFLDGI